MIDLILTNLVKFSIYFVIWYATGLLVLKKGVKTNYTRKINHFSLLLIPFLLDAVFMRARSFGGNENDFFRPVIGLLSGISYFLIFIKPIRERVNAIGTAFLSVDRPEDRPYTLKWITSQTAADFLVTIPFSTYLMMINRMELNFIVMIINGVGDGLAEPIGVRFGKHKYEVYALFTKKKYERSIEGSACVFITALVSIILFSFPFSFNQSVVALATIPVLMTLAEAFAPHSWDNPFLSIVGETTLFLILQFVV